MASIERRGPGQFRVRIRRKGHPTLVRTFTTRALAAAWAREAEGRMERGESYITPEAQRTTLCEALDRYQREITPQKDGADQERRRIDAWKRHPLAQRFLHMIRGVDMADYRDARLAGVEFSRFVADRAAHRLPVHGPGDPAPVGPDTVRLEIAVISNLYNVARREWGMEGLANPCDGVRRPKPQRPRARRVVGDELERILRHCNPVLAAAVTLAVETAMRRGELAAARREHIQGRMLILPKTKNGDERAVPLTQAALKAIASLPLRLDGYLLGWPATVRDDLTHGFRAACRAAGVEDLRFHDLRREAISRLFERGLTIAEVREISGHRTLSQLATYTKGDVQRLLAKLDPPAALAA